MTALESVTYVGCTRASRLQPDADRRYYRVTVSPSFTGYLTNEKFSASLAQLAAQLQAKSGDGVALTELPPASVDDEFGFFGAQPVSVDVMTLGAARNLTVGDLIVAVEGCAPLTVTRVELITADAAHSPDRVDDRAAVDDAAQKDSPLSKVTSAADKVVLAIIVLAIVAGLSYVLPRR